MSKATDLVCPEDIMYFVSRNDLTLFEKYDIMT